MKSKILILFIAMFATACTACKENTKEEAAPIVIQKPETRPHKAPEGMIFHKPMNTLETAEDLTYHVKFYNFEQAFEIYMDPEAFCIDGDPETVSFFMIKESSYTNKCGWYGLNLDMWGEACNVTPEDTTIYTITFDNDICNDMDSCNSCGYE